MVEYTLSPNVFGIENSLKAGLLGGVELRWLWDTLVWEGRGRDWNGKEVVI